jgi:hypothetical protein
MVYGRFTYALLRAQAQSTSSAQLEKLAMKPRRNSKKMLRMLACGSKKTLRMHSSRRAGATRS